MSGTVVVASTIVAVTGTGTGTGTGAGGGAGAGGTTIVAVSGAGGVGPAQDAISIYCIGLYKAKKAKFINFSGDEFKYYPNMTIEKVEKDTTNANHVLIYIKGGLQQATMHYSGFKNLLNTSPKELIENKTIPTSVELPGGTVDNDIKGFVKQITQDSYVPFCMMMQFYMNPDSILTKEYSPYELSLMSGLTIEPKENQKGELNCNFDYTLSIGTEFLATPPSIKTFDALKTTLLKKSALIPPLKNGKYNINNSLITQKVISGGGLKSCRGTSCPSSNLPRIYRQVIKVREPFERRTDYYNYA